MNRIKESESRKQNMKSQTRFYCLFSYEEFDGEASNSNVVCQCLSFIKDIVRVVAQ